MKIRNQTWLNTEKYLVLTLHKPFWSAWQKYGWTKGIEGLGVSSEAIEVARKLKKKIKVNVIKYGSYEITPTKALRFENNRFCSRDKKTLIVIPRDAFDRIPVNKAKKREYELKEHLRSVRNAETEQQEIF